MPAPRFVHLLAHLHVETGMHEHAKERDQARVEVLRKFKGYNRDDPYGMSNDETGYASGEPLPYIEPTPQTEEGYVGLAPPVG